MGVRTHNLPISNEIMNKIKRGCGGSIPQPLGQGELDNTNFKWKIKRGCGGSIPQPFDQIKGESKEKNKDWMLMLGIYLGSKCHEN